MQPATSATHTDAGPAHPSSRDLEPPFDGLCALLVTDLEQFTVTVQRLGDLQARSLIRAHNRILRGCLCAHAGREVAHTGDGMIAAFRSVARALACAAQMQTELERFSAAVPAHPLNARIGVHAGEPLAEEGRLFGTCVNTAVRVCGAAAGSRVVVSELVRQLAAGQDFVFVPIGPATLDGLSQPVLLSEFVWRRTTYEGAVVLTLPSL